MENQKEPLIHRFGEKEIEKLSLGSFFIIIFLLVVFGAFVGFIIAKISLPKNISSSTPAKKMVGIADKKTFKDQAEGILREGGIDGEGNFHLERPGGESQNVYLTSTTVDLSLYVGKKVRVWGETFTAQKAGWLMDVGLVEVL
ncbi:MAG: hypothetical protein QHH09_04555 [Microgenomates group bacterium]|nr:hypothetical protein [Microgenomates group bacterium]